MNFLMRKRLNLWLYLTHFLLMALKRLLNLLLYFVNDLIIYQHFFSGYALKSINILFDASFDNGDVTLNIVAYLFINDI